VRTTLIAGAATLAVLLAALLLWRGPAPGATAPSAERPRRPPPAAAARAPDPDLRWPSRDPFRYADQRAAGAAPPAPAPIAPPPLPPPAPTPSPNPLRLIGLVRRGGALKAALSMWGETVVLGEGEESRGYKVLSVDEERGVSLRGPDGAEVSLAPPSSS